MFCTCCEIARTESPTLSANGRALILQLIASCCFVFTIGDVQAAHLLADREEKPKGPLHVTMPESDVKEGMHPDQLVEVRRGYGLGDQGSSGGGLSRNSSLNSLVPINIRWIRVCSF